MHQPSRKHFWKWQGQNHSGLGTGAWSWPGVPLWLSFPEFIPIYPWETKAGSRERPWPTSPSKTVKQGLGLFSGGERKKRENKQSRERKVNKGVVPSFSWLFIQGFPAFFRCVWKEYFLSVQEFIKAQLIFYLRLCKSPCLDQNFRVSQSWRERWSWQCHSFRNNLSPRLQWFNSRALFSCWGCSLCPPPVLGDKFRQTLLVWTGFQP